MPAKQADRVWTRDEVLALPDDGNRYELVDGELLVSPGPRPLHQFAVHRLSVLLDPYVAGHGFGTLTAGPADLDLRAGQVVQPDVFVLARVEGRRVRKWEEAGIPLLVVEVLSPSNPEFDRVKKRRRYMKARVPTYWIVDLDARLVEVWTPEVDRPVFATSSLTWAPTPAIAPFVLDLPAFFAAVHDAG